MERAYVDRSAMAGVSPLSTMVTVIALPAAKVPPAAGALKYRSASACDAKAREPKRSCPARILRDSCVGLVEGLCARLSYPTLMIPYSLVVARGIGVASRRVSYRDGVWCGVDKGVSPSSSICLPHAKNSNLEPRACQAPQRCAAHSSTSASGSCTAVSSSTHSTVIVHRPINLLVFLYSAGGRHVNMFWIMNITFAGSPTYLDPYPG